MGQKPGVVVIHPRFDDQIRAHPAGRVLLTRQLNQRADRYNSAGDLKVKNRDYAKANENWQLGAQHKRAAIAIGYSVSTNSEDYDIIERAWHAVCQEHQLVALAVGAQ